ncbi:MAG: ATP-binding cassette domain-containing protein [Clostridia bacterium]|nr:ATP-binding cassette domain-containing protein [Clostridia bacterium]
MTLLELKNISFTYDKGKEILKNIHIQIEKGSFTGILGANGSGKTTLIQLLNGLLKPVEGQVLLEGRDIKKLKDKEVFSKIGLVFQNPEDQLFSYTVYEDVAYGLKNLGLKGEKLKNKVLDALSLLEISDLEEREIHKLSFGQKKRAAIAGVLAMDPAILILDEPTAGLDPITASHLIKILKRLQLEKEMTIILSTHEVDFIPYNCDQVLVLSEGRVRVEGTPEFVFSKKEVLRESNLRLPRIGHLMEILKEKDGIEVDPTAMSISKARKTIKNIIKEK